MKDWGELEVMGAVMMEEEGEEMGEVSGFGWVEGEGGCWEVEGEEREKS